MTFRPVEYGIQRGENFAHENLDCIVRSISRVAGIPYARVHEVLKNNGRKDKHGIRFSPIANKVFKELGIKARVVKRSGTVNSLIKKHPEGRLMVIKTGHAFTVIGGQSNDVLSNKCHVKRAWLITGVYR